MVSDRPILGILLMIGFCLLAPLGDSIAKVLGDTIPLGQLLLVRYFLQVIILLPLVLLTGRSLHMTQRNFWLMCLRTVLHILGVGAMFASLRFLPLADAVAIAFVMPFIMLLLGKYVLSEEVGPHRLAACAVGFLGTLLVIQPNFAAVGTPALLPLAVAVFFSFFMLVTRRIAKQIDPVSLQVSNGVIGTALLALSMWLFSGTDLQPFEIVRPSQNEVLLLAALGFLGTTAHLLMTWSLRYAPSVTLAPMQYLEIPFATFIGWLVFRDLPNALAGLGIVITVGAGLYVIYREQVAVSRQTVKI
ncbi:MAG: DMT family transporter [Hyphomicrobiales bacterium]|nr:DMT family transporter [Hyphomicrobiales bacterium]